MAKHDLKIVRRTFLKSTGAAVLGGAAFGFPQFFPSRVLGALGKTGANGRLTIAHVGVGGMGTVHLKNVLEFRQEAKVNLAAVCDADEKC